ncbi:Lrp/AsnC family transcriptional regulator [Peribacillus glennii]|uniref:Lrp/AsnC family transcriptional regulator n=1 Tax=Peribacillus glennii TaxID=2303991 RepID=A0A372L9Z3_9BACI|nr:Lrp/AsnC family transcriptional regulator [Peribacillus glennii]RFU62428.1 Lrp/AsnC family transcriptional regulator [Peribacillus glennii]
MKIDDIDRMILKELAKDSRLSMRELGKKVHMSSPAVTERVRQMESFGVIKGYSIETDLKKLGYPIECIVEATIKNGEYDRFKKYIAGLLCVDFCYRIAGQACYIIKIHTESIEKVEEFINDTIPYASTVTHIVLSRIETSNPAL